MLVTQLKSQLNEDYDVVRKLCEKESVERLTNIFEDVTNYLPQDTIELTPRLFNMFVASNFEVTKISLLTQYLVNSKGIYSDQDTDFSTLFSNANPTQLRNILKELEIKDCPYTRIAATKALIVTIDNPYWELYHLAVLYSDKELHVEALANYKLFYEKALMRKESNPIKHALVGILRSLFYVTQEIPSYASFVESVPVDIRNDKDILALCAELALILECKDSFNARESIKDKSPGYCYLNRKEVNEHIQNVESSIEVAPSHEDFYELFKLYALVNNKEKAKEALLSAFRANTLMFHKD
ncbi:MAG: hypothetical protein ABJI93_11890, partial [Nonlabens ulvanivorans]|uniref:hypothetical protein n=2 Tax=Pseudomonadati TaxID=3379134 RepID=UPI003299DDD1